MASRCWQLVLLVLVLALPAARTSGRVLAPDTSSPGALPFQATQPSDTCTTPWKVPASSLLSLARAQVSSFLLASVCRHRGACERAATRSHLQPVLRAWQALFQRHVRPRPVRCARPAAARFGPLGSRLLATSAV